MKSRDDSALHSSNNEKSEIDIILPNYNKFNYLKEAIDSVINQTFQDWHLYIIDDCSNDDSWSVIKKYSNLNNVTHIRLNKNKIPCFIVSNQSGLAKGELNLKDLLKIII